MVLFLHHLLHISNMMLKNISWIRKLQCIKHVFGVWSPKMTSLTTLPTTGHSQCNLSSACVDRGQIAGLIHWWDVPQDWSLEEPRVRYTAGFAALIPPRQTVRTGVSVTRSLVPHYSVRDESYPYKFNQGKEYPPHKRIFKDNIFYFMISVLKLQARHWCTKSSH